MRALLPVAIVAVMLVGLLVLGYRASSASIHQLYDDQVPAAPAVPCTITGRVHDGEGNPVPAAQLRFVDTTGTTSTHFVMHPRTKQISADDAGVFSVSLPFTPNRATVSGGHDYRQLDWTSVPSPDAGAMEFVLPKIAWAHIEAHVTDEAGVPLEEVHVGPGQDTTNDAGWVRFELLPEDVPTSFRVRKMGFKPVNLERSQLGAIVLRDRRTLVSVKLVDASTGAPLKGRKKVTAQLHDDLVSFCTTDAATSSCTLDADPGTADLELLVGKRAVKSVAVGNTALEVVLNVDLDD
jgi:hypothetical protein